MSLCLSVSLSFCLTVCLCLPLPVCLSLSLSVSLCLSVPLSLCFSLSLSISLSQYLSLYLSLSRYISKSFSQNHGQFRPFLLYIGGSDFCSERGRVASEASRFFYSLDIFYNCYKFHYNHIFSVAHIMNSKQVNKNNSGEIKTRKKTQELISSLLYS